MAMVYNVATIINMAMITREFSLCQVSPNVAAYVAINVPLPRFPSGPTFASSGRRF